MANGVVNIDIIAKFAQFERDIQRVEKRIGGLQTTATNFAKGFASAFVGAFGIATFGAAIKGTIDLADKMNDLNQKTGVAVKTLAGFRLVAEQNGTTLDTVAKGIQLLGINLQDAASGNDKLAKLFKQLGIEGTNAEEAFYKLADRIAATNSVSEKNKLVTETIGKKYLDLIPLLNQGSKALRESAAESGTFAEQMAKLAPNADKFNDNLAKLQTNAAGVAGAFLNQLVPSVNKLVEEFRIGTKLAGGFWESIRLFGFGISPFDTAGESLEKLGKRFVVIDQQIKRAQENDNQRALKNLQSEREDVLKKIKYLTALQATVDTAVKKDVLNPVDFNTPKNNKKPFDKTALGLDELERGLEEAADELERFSKLREDQQEADEDYANTLAIIKGEQKEFNDTMEQYRQTAIDAVEPTARLVRQLKELDKLESLGFDPELLAAWRLEINAQIDEVNGLNKELEDTKDIGKELGLIFTSAFEDAMVAGADFKDILGSIAKDIQRIFVRETLTKPIGGFFSDLFGSIDFGSLFGFAKGGIMTSAGPLPLRKYASGGVTNYPQLALFGEGSTPEAFVPLPDGRNIPVKLEGGSGTVVQQTINIDARGAESGVEAKIRQAALEGARMGYSMVINDLSRGGPVARMTGAA